MREAHGNISQTELRNSKTAWAAWLVDCLSSLGIRLIAWREMQCLASQKPDTFDITIVAFVTDETDEG